MSEPRLLLFDTASVYFRAYFGLPATLRSPDGRSVNAVRGLLDYLARFVTDYSPSQLACCWDNSWRPQWRVDLLPSYKAHRVAHDDVEEVPAELTAQVPLIREVLSALGVALVGADGYEADDVIATLARSAEVPTDVVTGDRDLFQVVDDSAGVRVLYLGRGAGRHDRVDGEWLRERYGVSPDQYVDFAVLRGDPSDGLPGVAGIGEKTAASLLRQHRDVEHILAAAQQGLLTPRVTSALTASVHYLAVAREVVRAADEVSLPQLDLGLPRSPADPDRFAQLASELGLGGSATRIVDAFAQARRT
jgi:5'-3' exonuclease